MGQISTCESVLAASDCQTHELVGCCSSLSSKELRILPHHHMLIRDGDVVRLADTVVGFSSVLGICSATNTEIDSLKEILPNIFTLDHTWKVGHDTLVDAEWSWERIVQDCPQYRHWTLKARTMPNIHDKMRLDVLIGSDEDGHSVLASDQGLSKDEEMDLYFDLGHFEIRLWLEKCSTTFHRLLCCLGQTQFTKACKSDGELCHFSLIGLLDAHHLARSLRLRFYWLQGLNWQCKEFPFSFQLSSTNLGNSCSSGAPVAI